MAQRTLGLAIGNELDNTQSKREERAVDILFPTVAKKIGTIFEVACGVGV